MKWKSLFAVLLKWKSLFAVLVGLLMVGVTAGSVNAQVFRPTTPGTSSIGETTFVSGSILSTQIPYPTKTVSPQDKAYYMNWIGTHTFKARVYEHKIPMGDTIYITRTIIISPLNIRLTMTSTEHIRRSTLSIDNMHSPLTISRTTSYETTVIATRKDDPFKWWRVSPYLPRWTWERSGDYYVAVDPINLVWGAPKSMVKDTLSKHSWSDYTSYGGRQYIYIPDKGWVEADDMFNGFVFGTQRHIRTMAAPKWSNCRLCSFRTLVLD